MSENNLKLQIEIDVEVDEVTDDDDGTPTLIIFVGGQSNFAKIIKDANSQEILAYKYEGDYYKNKGDVIQRVLDFHKSAIVNRYR